MGPDLRQLRYFVAVAEELSFTRAAKRLFIAQPSLSAQIARLETQIGVTLLHRDTRHVALTPDGEFLYRQAVDLIDRADALSVKLRDRAEQRRDTLTVGVWGHGAAELTRPVLQAFRTAQPSAKVRVRPADWNPVEQVVAGSVDVAVVMPPYPDERVQLTPLFLEPRVAVLAPGHALADAAEVETAALLDEPFPVPHPMEPRSWDAHYTLETERGEPARRHAEAQPADPALFLMHLMEHELVMTVHASFARLHASVGLCAARIADMPLDRTQVALATRREPASPLVATFVEVAQETTRQLIGLVPGAVLPDDPASRLPAPVAG